MKKVLLVLGLFLFTLSLTSFGQVSDLTNIKSLENEVNHIKLNLERSHDEFNTGCMIMLGSGALYSISLISKDQFSQKYIPWVSLGMSLVGTGFIIHSHKYIGKAGLGVSGQGVTVSYKF